MTKAEILAYFQDINAAYNECGRYDDLKRMLDELTEAKTGRWTDNKCSICGKGIEDLIDSPEWYENEEPNFCPFCGAKMTEGKE